MGNTTPERLNTEVNNPPSRLAFTSTFRSSNSTVGAAASVPMEKKARRVLFAFFFFLNNLVLLAFDPQGRGSSSDSLGAGAAVHPLISDQSVPLRRPHLNDDLRHSLTAAICSLLSHDPDRTSIIRSVPLYSIRKISPSIWSNCSHSIQAYYSVVETNEHVPLPAQVGLRSVHRRC